MGVPHWQIFVAAGALVIAGVQLCIYNVLDGPHGGVGEQIAHYFEFTFEGLSGLISFAFCIDNKFTCDEAQKTLLQANLMVGNSASIQAVEPEAILDKQRVLLKDGHSDCCKPVPSKDQPLLADYAGSGSLNRGAVPIAAS